MQQSFQGLHLYQIFREMVLEVWLLARTLSFPAISTSGGCGVRLDWGLTLLLRSLLETRQRLSRLGNAVASQTHHTT
jgi:hypothetical protein